MQPLHIKIALAVMPILVYTQVVSPIVSGGGTLFIPETNITTSKSLITQYDLAVSQAEKLASDVKTISKDLEAFDKTVEGTLEKIIPSSIDPVMFTDELTEFVKNENLPVTDFTQGENKGITSYPELGEYFVAFTFAGDYSEIKRVLKTIQSSLRLYDIQSVEITAPQKDGELFNVKVQAKTYFLR
jgi:hypothetical protein